MMKWNIDLQREYKATSKFFGRRFKRKGENIFFQCIGFCEILGKMKDGNQIMAEALKQQVRF